MHITIDGFGGNPAQLSSVELVRNLLDRYPDALVLQRLGDQQALDRR